MLLPYVVLAIALQQSPQTVQVLQYSEQIVEPVGTRDAAQHLIDKQQALIQAYRDEIESYRALDLCNQVIIHKQDAYIRWLKRHQAK